MDLWTARIPGKFLQLFEPRAAPLEEIVVRPAIGAGAIAALGLGMFHQRLGLEILVAMCHEPSINLNASRLGGRCPSGCGGFGGAGGAGSGLNAVSTGGGFK